MDDSQMFEGIDTQTLRTLHRQMSTRAVEVFTDATAAAAEDLDSYAEIMEYGRQLHGAVSLISTELKIRHQIYMAAAEVLGE